MYFVDRNFSIQTFDLSKLDNKFIEISYIYSNKFPFKWNFFVNKIIDKKEIFYARDTTSIININEIEFKKIDIVFEILKLYLNSGIIRKIIYKKEFAIVHFNDLFHIELLTNRGFLISIGLYKFIKEHFKMCSVYFGGILSIGSNKKIITMIMKKDNKLYVFDYGSELTYKLNDECVMINLYDRLNKNFIKGKGFIDFKVDHSMSNYKDKLNKIFSYVKWFVNYFIFCK